MALRLVNQVCMNCHLDVNGYIHDLIGGGTHEQRALVVAGLIVSESRQTGAHEARLAGPFDELIIFVPFIFARGWM